MAAAIAPMAVMLFLLVSGPAEAVEIGPGADWCAALQALAQGDELVLRPGEYRGACSIRHGGTATAPLVIRAKDPSEPPRIVYTGRDSNVLDIHASHVIVRGLQFGPTAPDVDAIRIHQGDHIVVEDSRFVQLGGIAVVANSTSIRDIVVRHNEILQSRSTGMYFGCHDGLGCRVTNLVIERNYVRGVSATPGEVGYGIQVKLNSIATVRDNVVVDTKGPGIMIYGAQDGRGVSIIEGNFVAASRTSSAIVVGGGPAIVRNNVAVGSADAGIGLENYGHRGLLRGVVLVHNTVYGNARGGIVVPAEGPLEVKVVNNAIHALLGMPVVPFGRPGVLALGNADCTWVPCFFDPGQQDFSPLAAKPGVALGEDWMPKDDYFGQPRGLPPRVGAVEEPAGPIRFGIKAAPR